jgi:hypothetical protein
MVMGMQSRSDMPENAVENDTNMLADEKKTAEFR